MEEQRTMKATHQLRDAGQSLWLDHITRGLVTGGGLARYIRDFCVSGLTSNAAYDLDRRLSVAGHPA
jgi:hypothetical protein